MRGHAREDEPRSRKVTGKRTWQENRKTRDGNIYKEVENEKMSGEINRKEENSQHGGGEKEARN